MDTTDTCVRNASGKTRETRERREREWSERKKRGRRKLHEDIKT